ncbi:hypothetical protein PBI_SCTP2_359 [Salicola phage SCTP-2]|nr:hypothetical protein PBI_SCTP2_359 [Salicola phage SCTP-2]
MFKNQNIIFQTKNNISVKEIKEILNTFRNENKTSLVMEYKYKNLIWYVNITGNFEKKSYNDFISNLENVTETILKIN